MKKILLFVTIVALMSSCNFLNLSDPDAFDESKFYQNQNDMESLLASSYEAFREATNNMFFVTEMKSDNATTSAGSSSSGLYSSFVTHQVMSSNSIVYNIYIKLYQTIHRANLTITHIDDIKWSSDNERARVLAEAKFMRSLAHFYLVRLWGPVTKLDHVVTSTAEANKAVRNTEEDVYQFIIQDLTEASQNTGMPYTYAAGSAMYGHASLTAVYALLGRVQLQYAATLNHPEAYAAAITSLKKAEEIGNCADLALSFADIFKIDKKQNEEIIFSVQYKATAEQTSNFAYYFQLKSGQTSYGTARGFNIGEPNLFNEFEATDGRKATAIAAYTTAGNTQYYTKKYVDKTNFVGYGGNDWYELRFADVYLMLAEAYEHEGNTSEAIKYLNKVRTRTGNGLSDYETSVTDPAYTALCPDLKTAIFHERRMELCFENVRWFDLQRLYPDHQALADYMHSITVVDFNVPNKFSDFQAYEALLPIPFNETYLNPSLGQNEGYTAY